MRWAPALFLPAPLQAFSFGSRATTASPPAFPFADFRFTPHYPAKSPLDDVLRLVTPGSDEYITEKYAFEIGQVLEDWSQNLTSTSGGLESLSKFLDTTVAATSLERVTDTEVRSDGGIQVLRRRFAGDVVSGRDHFRREFETYLGSLSPLKTAEFQIIKIDRISSPSLTVDAEIRYDLVGARGSARREERIGIWRTRWSRDAARGWVVQRWHATEETVSRAAQSVFVDVTQQALGQIDSYNKQLLFGTDHWRTVLDGACGIDVYGNSGVAAGDFDGDGFDDLYVCQLAGLPNRLYRNRGDGTFEDVTEKAGVGVLDATACALFADFENRGVQDLLVVCSSGPLLFVNEGNGKFSLKGDAFRFAKPPQGAFTHAAIADYDGDGRLDVYFCVYSYYVGLDQYRYPVPYFDARNGPPNFLLHNSGNHTFVDRTEAAGLHIDNDRYSFACAWGDYTGDGRPDLYVANDFGRSNLYRNNGDGTFTSVATPAGVEEPGAGMSASWFDFDNDGKQDIYVANMWSAAGLRVSTQSNFHESDPEKVLAYYRQHARGNSLYRNLGDGKFQNVSERAGVAVGRWAWSSDAWDFDHDGCEDLYIANGYISGPKSSDSKASGSGNVDASSFFWRQVVGKSPQNATASPNYERGWNAINELIRSDASWNGNERNIFYLNNRDGSFSEISGVAGLDFPDDSRAFALADIDHDGRLEVILKNRTAPQLRVLRNTMKELGDSIVFRLHGQKSNRDAIGATVTIEVGALRQTKYLQAGSGFLSQHTKELVFGVGKAPGAIRASIRWPSGLTQTLERLPANSRIEIHEGVANFTATPFSGSPPTYAPAANTSQPPPFPSSAETWLIQPLAAPGFSLTDAAGKIWNLQQFRGSPLLLHFFGTDSPECLEQMRLFGRYKDRLAATKLRIAGICLDDPADAASVRGFAESAKAFYPILLATPEIGGVYNLFYRYLFDRRRDLRVPVSFLFNSEGLVVKVYQGPLDPARLLEDLDCVPMNGAERIRAALPFPGTLYNGDFQRNDFTYGVAFFQRGYLEQAEASFKQVIAAKPDEPEAYYNLGTLHLRTNALSDARHFLEQAVKLRPNYPEAWNNLGMIAAQQNRFDEAVRYFQESLRHRPEYATALLNLANLYRRQGSLDEAQRYLTKAFALQPDDPETNYSLGMVYARREDLARASQYLERAVALRPEYPDALNNLGVLLVRERRYPEAEERFKTCIRVAQNFDQAYLNLAHLYVLLQQKDKAREVLQALLKEQPQHKLAQQALEMLN